VELLHDGTRVIAERGEPLAYALLAAGRIPLARSAKLHRPRAPYCLRGGCDGCLARVDGVPNVMTCLCTAEGGEHVETQNVLGTRGVDALRAADFLFPRGIDHHRLFAGVRGVSAMVNSFARHVAGLGKLPDEAAPIRQARRIAADVLIIGGGRAGLAAAAELAGARAILADDGPSLGGSTRALDPATLAERVARAGTAELRAATTVLALLREPERRDGRLHALLTGPEGATLVDARAAIVATGAHDPVLPFGNNDLPGVISARAALLLWHAGISVGERVVIAGEGRFAEAFAALIGEALVERVAASALVRAVGRSVLSAVVVQRGAGERKIKADALVLDAPGPAAMELAIQAGASAVFDSTRGYRLVLAADGSAGPGLWCAGSAASLGDSAADGARVGRAVARALSSR
jgi:sarcosine oxidase subunit alpha